MVQSAQHTSLLKFHNLKQHFTLLWVWDARIPGFVVSLVLHVTELVVDRCPFLSLSQHPGMTFNSDSELRTGNLPKEAYLCSFPYWHSCLKWQKFMWQHVFQNHDLFWSGVGGRGSVIGIWNLSFQSFGLNFTKRYIVEVPFRSQVCAFLFHLDSFGLENWNPRQNGLRGDEWREPMARHNEKRKRSFLETRNP